MPHLVEMHKKHAKDGLAVVSVALDENAQEKEVQERVLKRLKEKKASFVNLMLDEKTDYWQEKLDFLGPPSFFVFNRVGERKKQFKDEFEFSEVEKLVTELLKNK